MPDNPIIQQKHRFKPETYRGRRSVAFTACVQGRKKVFNQPEIVSAFVPLLGDSAKEFGCAVPIYTFMPDHFHVIMTGENADSNLKGAMDRFKFKTGWWFYRNRNDLHWQRRYWDHVVREFEGWREQAKYIAANPCRAGLCEDVMSWPFTGSIGFDLNEVIGDAFW